MQFIRKPDAPNDAQAIVAAAVLGLALYGLVSLAERAAIPWHVSFRRSR